ncbi:hypothetical protein PSAB6_510025 [Paraburkholderia sabiae]|nr:hypothetical protein PSAB6_510025 [Paraburkholderia sabiae]
MKQSMFARIDAFRLPTTVYRKRTVIEDGRHIGTNTETHCSPLKLFKVETPNLECRLKSERALVLRNGRTVSASSITAS